MKWVNTTLSEGDQIWVDKDDGVCTEGVWTFDGKRFVGPEQSYVEYDTGKTKTYRAKHSKSMARYLIRANQLECDLDWEEYTNRECIAEQLFAAGIWQ